MPIFNFGMGIAYETPVLNASYPADVSKTVVESETASASFEVKISENGYPESYTYQWYWNGTAVSGATSSSYTRSGLVKGTYSVYCKVTNKAGTVTSRTATVTVTQYTKPVLNSSYPANVTQMEKDGSTTFKVVIETAGNPASYTYQWYWNGAKVSGATSSSYTRSAIPAGTYTVYCTVTNTAGTVTSRTATVTVNRQYFYNAGNQMTSVTGGWTENYQYDSGDKLQFNTTSIYLDGEISVRTKNKINLADYKTLYIKYATNGVTGVHRFGVMASAGIDIYWDTQMDASVSLGKETSDTTKSLDVSSLTSSYYLIVGVRNGLTVNIKQIWGVLK